MELHKEKNVNLEFTLDKCWVVHKGSSPMSPTGKSFKVYHKLIKLAIVPADATSFTTSVKVHATQTTYQNLATLVVTM